MNIIEIATQAGLQVLLDARIGTQTYHSVCGSLSALQRFADAVSKAATASTQAQAFQSNARVKRRSPPPRPAAASRAKRSRRRVALCGRGAVLRARAHATPC